VTNFSTPNAGDPRILIISAYASSISSSSSYKHGMQLKQMPTAGQQKQDSTHPVSKEKIGSIKQRRGKHRQLTTPAKHGPKQGISPKIAVISERKYSITSI
jgi:hypothetical protein